MEEIVESKRPKTPNRDESHVILIFIDGMGVSDPCQPGNPFLGIPLQSLQAVRVLGIKPEILLESFSARCLDARLDTPGLPQSATGQSTIFTGVNASSLLGGHRSGLPNARLRQLIASESIFLKLARVGIPGIFANTFTPRFFTAYRRNALSVTTWATLCGGRPLNTLADLHAGRSIYQDFTNYHLTMNDLPAPIRHPKKAGEILALLSRQHRFVLYEYFITDIAGHSRDMSFCRLILSLLDRMITETLASMDWSNTTLLIVSDHGNIEDLSVKSHTTNPVPWIAWGANAAWWNHTVRNLTDITPAIVRYLSQGSSR